MSVHFFPTLTIRIGKAESRMYKLDLTAGGANSLALISISCCSLTYKNNKEKITVILCTKLSCTITFNKGTCESSNIIIIEVPFIRMLVWLTQVKNEDVDTLCSLSNSDLFASAKNSGFYSTVSTFASAKGNFTSTFASAIAECRRKLKWLPYPHISQQF